MKNNNRSLRRGFKSRRDFWETMARHGSMIGVKGERGPYLYAAFNRAHYSLLINHTGGPCR